MKDLTPYGGTAGIVAVAVFVWRKLVKLDGTTIRIVDEECQRKLAEKDKEIHALRSQVADLRVAIAESQALIASRDVYLADLAARISTLETELHAARNLKEPQ